MQGDGSGSRGPSIVNLCPRTQRTHCLARTCDGSVGPHLPHPLATVRTGAQEVLSAARKPPVVLRLSTPWQPPLAAHPPSLRSITVDSSMVPTLGLTIDGALVASLAQQVGP